MHAAAQRKARQTDERASEQSVTADLYPNNTCIVQALHLAAGATALFSVLSRLRAFGSGSSQLNDT